MEPAELIDSGRTLGKRQRTRGLPRTVSQVTLPSAAKQVRQDRGAHVTTSSGAVIAGGAASVGVCFVETAAFLKACGLCNRRLGPGHDTFIYRGEVAFCSQECRSKQIEYDERMEQTCSMTSIKEAPSMSAANGSDQSSSGGGETVVAA